MAVGVSAATSSGVTIGDVLSMSRIDAGSVLQLYRNSDAVFTRLIHPDLNAMRTDTISHRACASAFTSWVICAIRGASGRDVSAPLQMWNGGDYSGKMIRKMDVLENSMASCLPIWIIGNSEGRMAERLGAAVELSGTAEICMAQGFLGLLREASLQGSTL